MKIFLYFLSYPVSMEVDEIKGRKNIELYVNKEFGKIVVPSIPHKDRLYGGHLMVSPRGVYHHTYEILEVSEELYLGFGKLNEAAQRSMLDLIAEKDGVAGVINLLEAGNWQFHVNRPPVGIEKDDQYKSVHLHLYGRSPKEVTDTWEKEMLHWGWGEAPPFPRFEDTPFAPQKKGKKWIVPDQFNPSECGFLIEHIRHYVKK